MRLGLMDRPAPFKDDRGVYRMHARRFDVVDLDSEELVENVKGIVWGSGSILMDGPGALFTPDHFDREKDYLVVVVECPFSCSLGRRAPEDDERGEQ